MTQVQTPLSTLPSVEELKELHQSLSKEIESKNWNTTVSSIIRNNNSGQTTAWSDIKLTDEQIEELVKKGYQVTYVTINGCHKITW